MTRARRGSRLTENIPGSSEIMSTANSICFFRGREHHFPLVLPILLFWFCAIHFLKVRRKFMQSGNKRTRHKYGDHRLRKVSWLFAPSQSLR